MLMPSTDWVEPTYGGHLFYSKSTGDQDQSNMKNILLTFRLVSDWIILHYKPVQLTHKINHTAETYWTSEPKDKDSLTSDSGV